MTLNLTVKVSESGAKTTKNGLVKSLVDIEAGIRLVERAADALGEAYEFSKLGAKVQQTGESFDRMGQQLGLPIEQMARLREAAGGTISDLKLMSGQLTLTAGFSQDVATSFANAYPQLIQIARAAQALNPTLGDMDYMLSSISYGIKTSSQRVLDNLGIVVKAGDAYKIYADQLGISTQKLTAEQKQLALLNEVLRVGDNLIQQNGGNVASATDDYARFEANVENLKNALAQLWQTMTAGPVATAAVNAEWRAIQVTWAAAREEAVKLNQITEQQSELLYREAVGQTGIFASREEMIEQIKRLQAQLAELNKQIWINDGSAEIHWARQRRRADIDTEVARILKEEAREQALATVAMERSTIAAEEEHWALMESVYAHVQYYNALMDGREAHESWLESTETIREAQKRLREETERAAAAMSGDAFADLMPKSDVVRQIEDLNAELEKLVKNNGKTVTVTASTTEELNDAALAAFNAETAAIKLAEAEKELSENSDPDKQRELEGAVLRARDAFYSASEKAGELNGALTESGTYILDNSARIEELQGKIDGLNARKMAEDLFFAADAAGADALTLGELAGALDLMSEAQIRAMLEQAALNIKIEEFGEKIAAGMGIDQAIAELDRWRETIMNLPTEKLFTVRTVYVGGHEVPDAGSDYATNDDTVQAAGGDWIVERPTRFLAGEAGAERVTVQPLNSTTNSNNRTATIIINGALTTRQEAGALSDRLMGWM